MSSSPGMQGVTCPVLPCSSYGHSFGAPLPWDPLIGVILPLSLLLKLLLLGLAATATLRSLPRKHPHRPPPYRFCSGWVRLSCSWVAQAAKHAHAEWTRFKSFGPLKLPDTAPRSPGQSFSTLGDNCSFFLLPALHLSSGF